MDTNVRHVPEEPWVPAASGRRKPLERPYIMLALRRSTQKRLASLVNGLTKDRFLREDLMQEALIHFWKTERDRPGQTLSWYLQSCAFHLRHFLAAGRSVDSSKRRGSLIELADGEDLAELLPSTSPDNSVRAQVQTREILQLLSRSLTPREDTVLQCLCEGLGPRDIARRLKLSHPVAIKCRRKIAALALRLGISP